MTRGIRIFSLLVLLAALSYGSAALAVTCTSVNASRNWNQTTAWTGCTGGNGTPANTPGTNDDVIMANFGRTITVTADAAARSITFTGGNQNTSLAINAGVTLAVGTGGVTIGAPTNNRTKNISLAAGATALTVAGNVTLNGTAGNTAIITLGSNAGTTVSITGNLTANGAGEAITFLGAGTLDVGGNFTSGGTFTAGTGTVIYNGTGAQSIGTYTYNNLSVDKASGTATLAGNTTVNGNLSVGTSGGTLDLSTFTANRAAAGGTLTVVDGGTLKIGGTNGFPTNYNTHTLGATSTIEYGGAAQAVSTESYGHLTLSGSGIKTPAAGFTVRGDLAVTGVTFAGTTFTHIVNGNVSNTGTHTATTGTITLSGGTAAHALSGTGTYANLVMDDANGATLSASPTVSGVLTLTSGIVTTGANTLITTANCPGSVSRPGGGGHVAGFLRLQVPAAAVTCVHHVGDSTTYRPISLTFPATTTTGNLTGSVSAGDHTNIATSQLDSAQNVNHFWTLTNGGVGLGGGSYSATFTFVATDYDTNAAPLTFEVQRWTGASWAAPEIAGTRTATTTEATGLTAFSDFGVGQRRLDNFLVGGIPASPVCNPQTLTITARNSSNQTLTNYRGLVNLSTSTNHGDWSVVTANGTLSNGTADDGAATYQFVALDLGVAGLRLTNTNPETLTVSVNDSGAGVTSTSSSYQVDNYVFAITNGPIQVAGRDQAMSVQLNCVGVDKAYAGAKTLKAWVALNTDDPGGTRPSIGVVLPSSVPGAINVTLTFASGVASFNLASTDVGKYDLKLLDDSRVYSTATDINGTSSTITTRPFAIVVSEIKQGATINQGGDATSGSKFISAADSFQATVGAYKWNSTADGGTGSDGLPGDGVPDAGATLAQITTNGTGAAPSYRWTTTLAAGGPFTPATGALGTLINGAQGGVGCTSPNCFTNGVATPDNLTYSEVGSFTMSASATNFLNSGINLTAIVFDNSATPARSGVVGRFFPNHFTLTASSLTPACAGGSFTYMGQPNLGYTFGIEARNKSNAKTSNYFTTGYTTGTVNLVAENSNSGTDLGSNITQPGITWLTGSYSFSTSTAAYTRPVSPSGPAGGPFDSLQVGLKVTNINGDTSAIQGLDMDAAATGDCTSGSTCTAKSIGTTIVRFGRLMIGNANGSSALPLAVPIEAQYWNGKAFVTNASDGCTTIAASVATSNVAMSNYTGGLAITIPSPTCKTAIANGGILIKGRKSLQLAAPKVAGSVDLTVNLGAGAIGNACLSTGALPVADTPASLQHLQSGTGFTQNPTARATFGIFRGTEEVIFMRENF